MATLVEKGIKNPELIREQAEARQIELQQQGETAVGDIARAKQKELEVESERASYQRQYARGKISEQEFDARMAETEEATNHWREEVRRLTELRDDQDKLRVSLEYTRRLMAGLKDLLPKIDQTPKELRRLSVDERLLILAKRKEIVRALCDKITVYAGGQVRIDGLLDGSEGVQFGIQETCWP